MKVLVGEKDAGNDSEQITNELGKIFHQLLELKEITSSEYKELVNEYL